MVISSIANGLSRPSILLGLSSINFSLKLKLKISISKVNYSLNQVDALLCDLMVEKLIIFLRKNVSEITTVFRNEPFVKKVRFLAAGPCCRVFPPVVVTIIIPSDLETTA